MGFDGFWWGLMGSDGFWWGLMGFDGFLWVSMGFDGFDGVLMGEKWNEKRFEAIMHCTLMLTVRCEHLQMRMECRELFVWFYWTERCTFSRGEFFSPETEKIYKKKHSKAFNATSTACAVVLLALRGPVSGPLLLVVCAMLTNARLTLNREAIMAWHVMLCAIIHHFSLNTRTAHVEKFSAE